MPALKDFFAVFVLFWPAAIGVSFLAFMTLGMILFLIGGAIVIFSIFLYGAYALLRDTGSLDWIFEKLFTLKQHVTDHVGGHIRKSFLIEGSEKVPKGPCLFVGHPHGLYALSWFIHFSLGITEWPSERPVLAVHSVFFKIPFVRELFLRHNCIEATEEKILETLKGGNSVVLLVGGIEELSLTEPGTVKLILKKRSGYARIAKKANVPLVPLLTIGENELFPASKHWLWNNIQMWVYKNFHVAIPLPTWKSFWSWMYLMYEPLGKPVQTYILESIQDNSKKSIKDIKEEYLSVLNNSIDKCKHNILIQG